MGRQILVNKDDVVIDGADHNTGDVVIVSDDEFAALTAAGRFSGGSPLLTDQGAHADSGDGVYASSVAPAAPAALTNTAVTALTSAAAVGGTPTKAEYDALRTDLVNTRTTLAAVQADLTAVRTALVNLRTSLQGTGHALT